MSLTVRERDAVWPRCPSFGCAALHTTDAGAALKVRVAELRPSPLLGDALERLEGTQPVRQLVPTGTGLVHHLLTS